MASVSLNGSSPGFVKMNLVHNDRSQPSNDLQISKDLCCDIILFLDVQKQHERITFQYGRNQCRLEISGRNSLGSLATVMMDELLCFSNPPQGRKPIAFKLRHYSQDDWMFSKTQTSHLLSESIIKPSSSPGCAHVVEAINLLKWTQQVILK